MTTVEFVRAHGPQVGCWDAGDVERYLDQADEGLVWLAQYGADTAARLCPSEDVARDWCDRMLTADQPRLCWDWVRTDDGDLVQVLVSDLADLPVSRAPGLVEALTVQQVVDLLGAETLTRAVALWAAADDQPVPYELPDRAMQALDQVSAS